MVENEELAHSSPDKRSQQDSNNTIQQSSGKSPIPAALTTNYPNHQTPVPYLQPTTQSAPEALPTNPSTRKYTQQIFPQYTDQLPKPNDNWGSSISTPDNTVTRIYYQNINGLRVMTQQSKLQPHLKYMNDTGITISGFSETNTNWHYNNIKKTITTTIQTTFSNSSVAFSANRFRPPEASPYLPGGCMQMCRGHWTGRILRTIHDPRRLSRWVGHTYRLKGSKTLTVITAYRPCRQQSNSSDQIITATHQQTTLLYDNTGKHLDPRQIFMDDIITLIKDIESDPNHSCILMWDANESLDDPSGAIRRLIAETTLTDAFSHIAGKTCEIPTYSRGSKRIDFILTSQQLLPFIKRAGYLAFYESNESDHRGLFIDLDETLLDTTVELKRPPKRYIGSKSKKQIISDYKQYIHKQFQIHRIYERAEELGNHAAFYSITEEYLQKLNRLDKQITEIILAAEQSQVPRAFKSDWSVAIHQQALVCKYWALLCKGFRNRTDTSRQAMSIYLQITPTLQNRIDDSSNYRYRPTLRRICFQQLRQATTYQRHLISIHKELRQQGLLSLKTTRECEDNPKVAEIISKIMRYELHTQDLAIIRSLKNPKGPILPSKQNQYLQQWQRINPVFHPPTRSNLNTVEVPHQDAARQPTNDPDNAVIWKTISDPLIIEEKLLARNTAHFGQAQGTLFTTNRLQSLFGYGGTTEAANRLLKGNLSPSSYQPTTRGGTTLLNILGNKSNLPPIDDNVDFQTFCKALRTWSEGTSTSPSGRHLGHYKCLFIEDGEEYTDENPDPGPKILRVYYRIATAALSWGVSLNRWHTSITAMIQKIPGCSKINKLRVIHLYEADYNLLLKIIWARRLVWHAHDHDRLNQGQAGSRPGRNAIDVVIQKEMKYLYACLTRTGLATMDNDAKSCYDRIICNLAMIISQYFGVSSKAASMQAQTLQEMCFRLRTAIGDSQSFYKHSDTTPIHGTGQGSCASPAIWLLTSSLLMDCLAQIAGGMTLKDVFGSLTIQQWIDGFVDDTSLFANLLRIICDSNDIRLITEQLQKDMIAWKELLEASGGKLELTKCFYYILTWKFDRKGNPLPTTVEEQRLVADQISIPDGEDRLTIIPHKDVTVPHKTLGCLKSILGHDEAEMDYVKHNSDAMGNMIKNSPLNPRQGKLAHSLVYISSLKYGLPSSSLTYEQIEKAHRYAVDKFLSVMGIDHSTHRALVYGPAEYGGFGIKHLYTEMHGMKLDAVISHIRADTQLGTTFRININYIQLQSGVGNPIMASRDNISYLPKNWILHLRNFLLEVNARIEISELWSPSPQRESDQYIMESFKKLCLSRSALKELNNWRMYYQVIFLSELCFATSKGIQPYFMEYNHENNPCQNRSTLNWPVQAKPDENSFKLWRRSIKAAFINKYNNHISNLGQWNLPAVLQYAPRLAYYQHSEHTIYLASSSSTFTKHPANETSRTSATFSQEPSGDSLTTIPEDCIPADLYIAGNTAYVKFGEPPPMRRHRELTPTGNEWKANMLHHLKIVDEAAIIKMFNQVEPPLFIVSDGGVHSYQSNFGVILAEGTLPLATSMGKIYSVELYESSHRSEMYGMLAGIIVLKHLITYLSLNIPEDKKLQFFCDNRSVVRKVNDRLQQRRTVNQHRYPDADIELQLVSELQYFIFQKCNISIAHVKGHQEKRDPSQPLKTEEYLNIMADDLTHKARRLPKVTKYTPFPSNSVNFVLNGQYINSNFPRCVSNAYHSMALRDYFTSKHGWSNSTTNSIWWQAYHQSITKLPDSDKIKIRKFINNLWPTLKKRQKYKQYPSSLCQQCRLYTETEDHILRCRTPSRQRIRDAWKQEITTYLDKSHTPVEVKYHLSHGMFHWLENGRYSSPAPTSPPQNSLLARTITTQDNIGWQHFIRGRASMEWGTLINQHLGTQKRQKISAEQWCAQLFAINWKHILDMWSIRNQEIHGSTPAEAERIQRDNLIEEIIFIRDQHQDIPLSTRDLINKDRSELVTMSVRSLSTYLYSQKLIVKAHRRHNRNTSNNTITKYFTTIPPEPHLDPEDRSELDPGEQG
jgi:Reverse transcriptase (RNA-dependent DNA polymerase)